MIYYLRIKMHILWEEIYEKLKSAALHIIVFVCTVVSLWLLLVLSSSIPNNLIKSNIEKSALTYKNKEAFSSENSNKLNAVADNYSDSILLNVTWNMGEGNSFVPSLRRASSLREAI